MLVSNIGKARRPILWDARETLASVPCRKVGVVVVGERVGNKEYYSYHESASEAGNRVPSLRG